MLKLAGRRGYDTRRLRVFGDAAGHGHHSNIGTTDYEILEEKVRRSGLRKVEWRNLDAAPLVKDSLNSVRARVCMADNVIHLYVHPRRKHLIKDMKTASWPDGSNNLKTHHTLAALRYYCWALFGDTDGYGTGGLDLPNTGGRNQG